MRKTTLLFLIIGFNFSLFAQYEITIEAQVLDYHSKQPIPYVNIEFTSKNLKTVTDKNGFFSLTYDEAYIGNSDVLQLVSLGYKTEKVKASQFYKFLQNTNKIYMIFNGYKQQNTITKSVITEELTETIGNIYGTVTNENTQLEGAVVRLKNKFTETVTNSEGKYRLEAKMGDVLVVSYLGMKTKEFVVENDNEIDFQLESDGLLLDEVLLEGKFRKEEQVDLGLGSKKSFDEIGYSINTMDEDDIGSQYQNFKDLLLGKFAGLRMSIPVYVGLPPVVYMRNNNSANNEIPAIFDIDGSVYETWPNIEVQNIKNITILKSLASVTKYGTIGRGGVIVIKTKTASGATAEPQKPSALATGNDYAEHIQSINTLASANQYMQALQNANTFDEAKKVYKTLKQTKDNLSVALYLNAAEYFLKWDKQYAYDIFTYVEDLAKDNAKALKSLAFKYESLSLYEKARLVYQNITLLRPTDAQSYRDLALIYKTTSYYNEAMRLYKQMLSNSIEGVDFSGLQQPIIDELMHLLAFHRSKVDYRDLPADLLTANFKQDLRIVFEWNDPNAEFELQFVNPQKKFYKWSHTKFDNRERMLDEIKKGYTTEAYIIDDAEAGEWMINVESFTEETNSINPTYLKYTVYKNYGLPNETYEIKVVKLSDCKPKVTFDRLVSK